MLVLGTLYVLSIIFSYRIMKNNFIKYLKRFKEDGYEMKRNNGKAIKNTMVIVSLIPMINLLFPIILGIDIVEGREKTYLRVRDDEDYKKEIYQSNTFNNIDKVIRELEEKEDIRLQINKIVKYDKIKDKIKLFKIAKILDFSSIKYLIDSRKKPNEVVEEEILYDGEEVSYEEALAKLRKELDEYKEEKMKSVPTIQVRKEDENKEELLDDDQKLVPIMNFSDSESSSEEIVDKKHSSR